MGTSLGRGEIVAVWAGITRASWSTARRGKLDYSGYPPPVRDSTAAGILGLPNRSLADQKRVQIGNRLVRWLARLIKHCLVCKVPCFVENPASSRIWICPALQPLLAKCETGFVLRACQFGEKWMKATRIAGWNQRVCLERRCARKNNLCSAANEPHLVLTGTSANNFRTVVVSAYLETRCACFAEAVITSQPETAAAA